MKVSIKGKTGSVEKSVHVLSNDPEKSEEVLTLRASIRESIQISSKTLRFRGKEGTVQTQSVDIIAQEEKPLSIKPGVFSLQEKMTYSIKEIEKGKSFRIEFTNMPQPAGRFNGSLIMTTNYDDNPEIKISISANFIKNPEDNDKKQ